MTTPRLLRSLAFLLLPFAFCFLPSASAQVDRIVGKPFATRSAVLGRHGMVCTSVPAASQAGLDILKHGGNAIDAAIAANATLGLMEPISNGIGGDLFAIVYIAKENKLYGINGSGRSPLGLSYEQAREEVARLHRNFLPPIGMLPINVPGAVDAWATMRDRFGKLTLADDLSPAAHYAEDGFRSRKPSPFTGSATSRRSRTCPARGRKPTPCPRPARHPPKATCLKTPPSHTPCV